MISWDATFGQPWLTRCVWKHRKPIWREREGKIRSLAERCRGEHLQRTAGGEPAALAGESFAVLVSHVLRSRYTFSSWVLYNFLVFYNNTLVHIRQFKWVSVICYQIISDEEIPVHVLSSCAWPLTATEASNNDGDAQSLLNPLSLKDGGEERQLPQKRCTCKKCYYLGDECLWDLTFIHSYVCNHRGKSDLLTCPLLLWLPSPERSAVANQKQTKSIYFYEKEKMLLL